MVGGSEDVYLAHVEHYFSFNVVSLLVHHIYLGMELPAEVLHICMHKPSAPKFRFGMHFTTFHVFDFT